jgi:SAM-dependent methyltransferase
MQEQETASDGHVLTGRLTCERCGKDYPVEAGVPRFAPSSVSDAVASTVDGFGYQWTTANPVLSGAHFSSSGVFLDFINPVRPDYLAGKTVLDGGCGLGRFTLLSAEFGARVVVGVDLSRAVEAAFANTRHMPNVVIAQADLFELPFEDDFEYIFSVGVLHHTSNPRAAFQELATKLRPGGGLSAWVYAREGNGWILRLVNPIRTLTSRWPRPALLAAAHLIAIPLWIVVKTIYRSVARFQALAPLRRFLFYYDYMVFLSQFGYREQAYIVFDHMVPELSDYIEREAFAEWFQSGGLSDVIISSRSGNSWRGFGLKRAASH